MLHDIYHKHITMVTEQCYYGNKWAYRMVFILGYHGNHKQDWWSHFLLLLRRTQRNINLCLLGNQLDFHWINTEHLYFIWMWCHDIRTYLSNHFAAALCIIATTTNIVWEWLPWQLSSFAFSMNVNMSSS